MFKFSLRLCIWLALLVGSVLGLVLDREPWVADTKSISFDDLETLYPGAIAQARIGNKMQSPDETRRMEVKWDYSGHASKVIIDTGTFGSLYEFKVAPSQYPCFVDNDTVLIFFRFLPDGTRPLLFHRRFPEWWWGIFYRPLFWIAAVVFFGTVFEFVSMRKRLSVS